jgi:molybdopterin-guanine dinucleotide biosynthesis protein A
VTPGAERAEGEGRRVPGVAGLLLTGGASRRLGFEKALLRVDGDRLADRVAHALTQVVAPVIEVGPGYTSLPAVREDPPGTGPLLALAAGADALAARGVRGPAVVLAVDLPGVDESFVEWLASHPAHGTVVPVVEGVRQTLCARYGADALAAARGVAAAGGRALRTLLDAVLVHEADESEWGAVTGRATFVDVDTPDDVAALGLEHPG